MTKTKSRNPISVRDIWVLTGLSREKFTQELGLTESMVKFLLGQKRGLTEDTVRKLYLGVGAKMQFDANGRCSGVRDALTGARYNKKSYARWKEVEGFPSNLLAQFLDQEALGLQVILTAAHLKRKFLVAQDELANAMYQIAVKLDLMDNIQPAADCFSKAGFQNIISFQRGETRVVKKVLAPHLKGKGKAKLGD